MSGMEIVKMQKVFRFDNFVIVFFLIYCFIYGVILYLCTLLIILLWIV